MADEGDESFAVSEIENEKAMLSKIGRTEILLDKIIINTLENNEYNCTKKIVLKLDDDDCSSQLYES